MSIVDQILGKAFIVHCKNIQGPRLAESTMIWYFGLEPFTTTPVTRIQLGIIDPGWIGGVQLAAANITTAGAHIEYWFGPPNQSFHFQLDISLDAQGNIQGTGTGVCLGQTDQLQISSVPLRSPNNRLAKEFGEPNLGSRDARTYTNDTGQTVNIYANDFPLNTPADCHALVFRGTLNDGDSITFDYPARGNYRWGRVQSNNDPCDERANVFNVVLQATGVDTVGTILSLSQSKGPGRN
jgi:hypothetical protein